MVLAWLDVGAPEVSAPVVLKPVLVRQIPAQPAPAVALGPPVKIHQQQQIQPARRERSPNPAPARVAAPAANDHPVIPPTTSAARPVAEDRGPVVPAGAAQTAAIAPGDASATLQGSAATKGVTLPSSMADYLSNPPPTYPALSLRLNEQGKVVVRVLIGKNGQALEARLAQSSGFDRLDHAALRAVLAWRYVPGKVDGQTQDMWFDIPVNFKPPR